MSITRTLRLGSKIARAEWTRHRRERGKPLTGNPLVFVVLVGIAIGLGWLAYSIGQTLSPGKAPPYDRLRLGLSVAFVWMMWRSSQYTHVRFERLNPDLLLTTVPARTVVVGLLGFVFARLSTSLLFPTFGLVGGAMIGLGSPGIAVSIGIAVAAMAVLAVALGTVGRLAGRLVALRLVRISFYRDLIIVFGWIPLIAGAMILQELSISIAPVVSLFGASPIAWFVDLALLGTGDAAVSGRNAFGVLVLLVFVVPLLVGVTTILACRIWEHSPARSTADHSSHALLKTGVVERIVGPRIPRAVYTVARKRWLMERRVPRGLLSTGYVLVVMGLVGFPAALFLGEAPTLLVLFAVTLGVMAGIAFGADPIGTEYRVLPMVLTAVSGRQFIYGVLLAAAMVGVPLVAVVIVPLGLVGPVGPLQTVLTALLGWVVCVCTAAVALAVGFDVDRYEFAPLPFFFTDVPIYAEQGVNGFLRYGQILVLVLLACVPAFAGTSAYVSGQLSSVGIPRHLVRTGSLLLTLLTVTVLTRTAIRIAIQRYQTYQI
jgi:ABC-2 type transport system permease protein